VSLHDTEALEGPVITRTAETVSQLGLDNSSARLLPTGTVVFSRTATVGKSTVLARPMATSQDFANYVCGPRLHNRYLMHLFRFMQPEWSRLMAGSTHNTIYMPVFEALEVLRPPFEEQKAIAAALDDADALIASLEQLVSKKRAVRAGVSRELLTGVKRLPGFSDPWHQRGLGSHVTFLRTASFSRAQMTAYEQVACLHYGDVHAAPSVHLNAGATPLPRVSLSVAKSYPRLRVGDVVFVDASEDAEGVGKSVEITALPSGGLIGGLHTIAARFDGDLLADGFKGYLQEIPTFRSALVRWAAGLKVLATSSRHIADVELLLPGIDEQSAIARVLCDVDVEINALETRRRKTILVRQGMAQALLTGRVRLPVAHGAAA
jgi:type I restriction enzyme S subunit